jgi:hypothetical protein
LQQHSKDENSVPDTKNVEGRVGENESWKLPNVLEFISKLPDQKRQEVESDFAEIFSLYDDAGIVALLDEASFHGEKEDLLKEWGEDSSVEARVFSAFLYHPEIWKGATRFHDADTTRASYWCGLKDLPGGPADVSEAAAHRLAQEVGKLFVEMHGKGHHCVVDMYKRGEKDYYFAYPEDYCRETMQWRGSELERTRTRFAETIIFVYDQKAKTLDVCCKGVNKKIERLQQIFGECILGIPALSATRRAKKLYELDVLLDKDFQFKYPSDAPIEKVCVSKLRLARSSGFNERYILENPAWKENPELMSQMLETFDNKYNLNNFTVTRAEIKVVVTEADGTECTETIQVTPPNRCTLQHNQKDDVLRQMLFMSGIADTGANNMER